jgi:hypothetical protein
MDIDPVNDKEKEGKSDEQEKQSGKEKMGNKEAGAGAGSNVVLETSGSGTKGQAAGRAQLGSVQQKPMVVLRPTGPEGRHSMDSQGNSSDQEK